MLWVTLYFKFGGSEESPVPRNVEKAQEYFKEAVLNGDATAQFYMGYIYSLRDNQPMSLL